MVISSLVEDNKSELAIPGKLNSYKANLNRYRKRPWLELAVGIFMENSNSKLVIRRRRLAKGKYNPSTNKPILASNSDIREIAVDNSKSL